MNTEQHAEILTELRAIRAALEARPLSPPSPAKTQAANATQSTPDAPVVIPQPAEVVPNAGSVTIHFGKNSGKPLSELGERSLSWYATEQPARLDSNGQPYPRRPQETALLNAARTLWHQNHGTLAGPQPPLALKADAPATEEVPF